MDPFLCLLLIKKTLFSGVTDLISKAELSLDNLFKNVRDSVTYYVVKGRAFLLHSSCLLDVDISSEKLGIGKAVWKA